MNLLASKTEDFVLVVKGAGVEFVQMLKLKQIILLTCWIRTPLKSKGIPEFRLRVKPSALRELSPISRMPLEAEFEDDYQIASVKVLYTGVCNR